MKSCTDKNVQDFCCSGNKSVLDQCMEGDTPISTALNILFCRLIGDQIPSWTEYNNLAIKKSSISVKLGNGGSYVRSNFRRYHWKSI